MFIAATVTGRALSALSDEAVDELFAGGVFPIMAGSLKPSGAATQVDGGFRVSGQWAWGSGVQHADGVIVPVRKDDKTGATTAVVPRAEARIIDNRQNALAHQRQSAMTRTCDTGQCLLYPATSARYLTPAQRRGGTIFRMGYAFAANEHAGSGLWRSGAAGSGQISRICSSQSNNAVYGAGISIADREIFQRTVAESELRLRACQPHNDYDVLERLSDASASTARHPSSYRLKLAPLSVLCTDEAIADHQHTVPDMRRWQRGDARPSAAAHAVAICIRLNRILWSA